MHIYQHFRNFEHPFVDQVFSWMEQVERTYIPYVTDFLDPREQEMIATIIGTNHEMLQFQFFGGYVKGERKRACIAPVYETITEDDFSIRLLEGNYPSKFVTLKHPDILGAFMSLGIERKTLGDIFADQGIFQFFLTKEMHDYVQMNLTQIKQATVRLEEKPLDAKIVSNEQWQEQKQTVSSLRLDVVMKEIYRLPRSRAAEYIKKQKVKVNFTRVEDPAIMLMAGDMISVSGYGRSKLINIEGETKKGKIRVVTAKLVDD